MAENKSINVPSSNEYERAGGDGRLIDQRRVVGPQRLIQEAVKWRLKLEDFSGDTCFCIADLGCFKGPNTLVDVQNILGAVKRKYQGQNPLVTCTLDSRTVQRVMAALERNPSHDPVEEEEEEEEEEDLDDRPMVPEFHVYFNAHVSNDSNTLFRSLPLKKRYYASGVPGSFHGRLFPAASIHFVHSSYSLHWLSRLPEEITERNSPAWNKGRIHYLNAGKEVTEAYGKQYASDMDSFLNARAPEVVPGGLVVIIVPGRPDGDQTHSQVNLNLMFDTLGSCLVDLASKGKIDEEEVNSVNVPIYLASAQELEAIVRKNGYFTLEKVRSFRSSVGAVGASAMIGEASVHMRAITEALITENIGSHVLDELFHLYEHKLKAAPKFPLAQELNLFVLLKRKFSV